MHLRTALLGLVLVACTSPPQQLDNAPVDAPTVVPDPEAIRPAPERSRPARAVSLVPSQPPEQDWYETHKAPRFQIEAARYCPTCYGFGGTLVALTPSRKAAEDHAKALRSLLVFYKGSEWNRHLTTVPWFGEGKYALIFANTFTEPGEQMCDWLRARGWGYGSGLPGTRECKVYPRWPPDKP